MLALANKITNAQTLEFSLCIALKLFSNLNVDIYIFIPPYFTQAVISVPAGTFYVSITVFLHVEIGKILYRPYWCEQNRDLYLKDALFYKPLFLKLNVLPESVQLSVINISYSPLILL